MPSQLEYPPDDANDDLDPCTRDVDNAAYRDVPRFCQDCVRMAAGIDDRAPLIGARRFSLSSGQVANRNVGDADGRSTFPIEP